MSRVTRVAILHAVTGPPGSRLAKLLAGGLEPCAPQRGVIGCFERVVASVSITDETGDTTSCDAGSALPEGPALHEAIAVRLRRSGAKLQWGAPSVVPDLRSLLAFCRARGRSSIEVARADPSLVSGMQLGAWFDAGGRMRALRRLASLERGRGMSRLALSSSRWLAAVADMAFWAGVRERASPQEWRRFTASSYVALVYHRFAGEMKPGQERVDIAPARFERQLRALRIAGFRTLTAEEILAFHAGTTTELSRGSFAITVDDALADCVTTLRRHVDRTPQLFVSTHELSGFAHWLAGEPVATWEDVLDLAGAGVAIGSHARRHRRLTPLSASLLQEELDGSLADLRARLPSPLEVVAYPNGDHDLDVCRAARAAGFRAGFTTQKGRNGAGTDPFCLRRVSVHGQDGALAVLWKVLTGQALPAFWLRLRARRGGQAAA
jgi:peptidoglycan/xylan/chitin deacetylase (PgdA/CDA1 family)